MQATSAVRERLLPLCLSISAFRVEGQMVKNNFSRYPSNPTARQLSACHQEGGQEQVSPLLFSLAESHRVFQCSLRGYCTDSGMVLTT